MSVEPGSGILGWIVSIAQVGDSDLHWDGKSWLLERIGFAMPGLWESLRVAVASLRR